MESSMAQNINLCIEIIFTKYKKNLRVPVEFILQLNVSMATIYCFFFFDTKHGEYIVIMEKCNT